MFIELDEEEIEICYCALHFYTMMFGLQPYACVDKDRLRDFTYNRYLQADKLCSKIEDFYYKEND